MRVWGFDSDELEGPPVQIWPENRRSVAIFLKFRTQWRWSGVSRTGLDYTALDEIWHRSGVAVEDRDAIFADLQILELAALKEMNRDTDG